MRKKGPSYKNLFVIFALLFATTILSACISRIEKQGHLIDDDQMQAIVVGQSSKQTVLEKLGTPTITSAFDPNKWIYVSINDKVKAFLAPELEKARSISISFNEQGIVSNISMATQKDFQNIEPNASATPSYGHNMSLMQQILGNFGRFNNAKRQEP